MKTDGVFASVIADHENSSVRAANVHSLPSLGYRAVSQICLRRESGKNPWKYVKIYGEK